MIFVAYSEEDRAIFREILDELATRYPAARLDGVDVARGDINQFTTHNCSTIVNAANIEVSFGGGISGAIGNATGRGAGINAEALGYINQFNDRVREADEAGGPEGGIPAE